MKLILSTICIVLLALFAYQVMSFPLDADPTQQANQDNDLAKSINYDLPQLAVLKRIDDYSEIVQRPLFAKDRAAAVSVQAVTNKVTTVDELSHLVLVGTASSSDVQIAIVADTKAKKMERLKTGEAYQEWEIAEVSSDYVIFQNEELEYKLFVTPIRGSQKEKQAKLVSQLNKSKIEKANAANKSYKGWSGSAKSSARSSTNSNKPKQKIAGKIWNYDKKPAQKQNNETSKPYSRTENQPAKRSPIKIPGEEEKDASYYEAEEDSNASGSSKRDAAKKEISAEDFYDDEDITEDELKALEGLGAKIFDD